MKEATGRGKFSEKRVGDERMILVVEGTRSTQEVGSSRIDDSSEEQPRQTTKQPAAKEGIRLGHTNLRVNQARCHAAKANEYFADC